MPRGRRKWSRRNFVKMFDTGKTRMIGLPYGEKNYDNTLCRFHTIPERNGRRDRRTDKQTDLLYHYRASVCWRAVKKQLNTDKTVQMWVGSRHRLSQQGCCPQLYNSAPTELQSVVRCIFLEQRRRRISVSIDSRHVSGLVCRAVCPTFLPRYAMHKRGLCVVRDGDRLSVHLADCHVRVLCQNE